MDVKFPGDTMTITVIVMQGAMMKLLPIDAMDGIDHAMDTRGIRILVIITADVKPIDTIVILILLGTMMIAVVTAIDMIHLQEDMMTEDRYLQDLVAVVTNTANVSLQGGDTTTIREGTTHPNQLILAIPWVPQGEVMTIVEEICINQMGGMIMEGEVTAMAMEKLKVQGTWEEWDPIATVG